ADAGAMYGREQIATDRRQILAGHAQALQAALELAEVLHARNDFLARIAAFLETDATDGLQVDHLRDEQFAGGPEDLADAGAHLTEQPVVEWRFAKLGT